MLDPEFVVGVPVMIEASGRSQKIGKAVEMAVKIVPPVTVDCQFRWIARICAAMSGVG
jgi:hypothetical protein